VNEQKKKECLIHAQAHRQAHKKNKIQALLQIKEIRQLYFCAAISQRMKERYQYCGAYFLLYYLFYLLL